MKFALGGIAASVFALASLATLPPASASPDNDFIDALAKSGLSFPPQATLSVVNGGHAVCRDFATGASYHDALAGAAGPLGGNPGLSAVFVRVATSSLCPTYISALP